MMQKMGKVQIVKSEYWDDKGEIPFSLVACNRTNTLSIKRSNVYYLITVNVRGNNKAIKIEADVDAEFEKFYELVMDIIRFENLFDGRFFRISSWEFDGNNMLPQLDNKLLGYMNSRISMSCFYIKYDDTTYRSLFNRFEKYLNKKLLQYHISLYSTYLDGMPVDLRLAQLIEIFEPLACELYEKGEIRLRANPYLVVKEKCPKCGCSVAKKIRNKGTHLEDLIKAVIKRYGKDIFDGDSVAKVVRKAVVLRNKIDHVSNQRGSMTGPECGFYLYKFQLLYRIIVMQEIGIPYESIEGRVKILINDFNKKFANQRLLP